MIIKERISKNVCEKLIEAYRKLKHDHYIDISVDIEDEVLQAFTNNESYVLHDEAWNGFLVVFYYDRILYLNPWFFGGFPLGDDDRLTRKLLEMAIQEFNSSKANKILLISNDLQGTSETREIASDLGIELNYDYVDMILDLREMDNLIDVLDNITYKNVSEANLDNLKECYHKAFIHGDAKFYFDQTEKEKKEFWNSLGYEDAKDNNCSIAMYKNNELIGFSLVLDYGDKNKHISCMAIDPDEKGKGYGKLLMNKIINTAKETDNTSITLGTEHQMRAFKLYEKVGFKSVNVKGHYVMRK